MLSSIRVSPCGKPKAINPGVWGSAPQSSYDNKKEAGTPTLAKLIPASHHQNSAYGTALIALLMITGFFRNCKKITQSVYDQIVNTLDLSHVFCICHHAGCLVRHGFYSRKLKTDTGTITLRILRVKCKECGRTHALLPDQAVPYSQLPVDIQQFMLLNTMGNKPLEKLMDNNPDITESDVLRVRFNFRHYWEQRLKSIPAVINCCIQQLTALCYSAFKRQFMQIRRGIYLVNTDIHIA